MALMMIILQIQRWNSSGVCIAGEGEYSSSTRGAEARLGLFRGEAFLCRGWAEKFKVQILP